MLQLPNVLARQGAKAGAVSLLFCLCAGLLSQCARGPGSGLPVQWSRDGRRLLVKDLATDIGPGTMPSLDVLDLANGTRRRVVDGRSRGTGSADEWDIMDSAQWFSDGMPAYVDTRGGRRCLTGIDLDTKHERMLAELPRDTIPQSVLLGPRQRALFMRMGREGGPADPNLWLIDAGTQRVRRLTRYRDPERRGVRWYPFRNYRWSTDGQRVLFELHDLAPSSVLHSYLERSLGLWIVDIDSGRIAPSACSLPGGAIWLDWVGTDPEVSVYLDAAVHGHRSLRVRNCLTGEEATVAEVGETAVAVLSPHLDKLAFSLSTDVPTPQLRLTHLHWGAQPDRRAHAGGLRASVGKPSRAEGDRPDQR